MRPGKRPRHHRIAFVLLAASLCFTTSRVPAATTSQLYARGITVLPQPQQVKLGNTDFPFGEGWRVVLGVHVPPNAAAENSLREGLRLRFGITLSAENVERNRPKTINLAIVPGSTSVGAARDRAKDVLAQQAYKIDLTPHKISITANAAQGLFYGVQTLLQLPKYRFGQWWLPEGKIVDWPDLELRELFWDDASHIEHLNVLKAAIRQAAFFKINAFSLKLDGHFQYHSAPTLVDPYAFSPVELQELTTYALHYYVQLIPYIDGPGHVSFILKYPEYQILRSFPQSNYEMCVTNPNSYKLLFGMYQDLLNATRGAKYIHMGGDEPYFIGWADNSQCQEVAAARKLGSRGKLLAQFYGKTGAYLHHQGRQVLAWLYEPLVPSDIPSLPSYLVGQMTFGPKYDSAFKAQGIRQLIYANPVMGDPYFFPDYYVLSATRRLHPLRPGESYPAAVPEMFQKVSFSSGDADLIGAIDTGWSDEGLHPETFWLGYATGLAYAWHPGSPDPEEEMETFYRLFYGPSAVNMGRLYQLMSTGAQFWQDSWDTVPSTHRKPIFGGYRAIFNPSRPADDQTLLLPAVPEPAYLTLSYDWASENTLRLNLVDQGMTDNDELLSLLDMNLGRVEFNRYSLEVFVSVAQLYRQNLLMIQDLNRMNDFLELAHVNATRGNASGAIADLDQTLDIANEIHQERNIALNDARAVWYESWFPRVEEANGRRFVDQLDNVKDHLVDRTVDMSYLVLREIQLPMGKWVSCVQAVRNQYAQAHGLPLRSQRFNWQDTETTTAGYVAPEPVP
jgi:hexosaminidase